MTRNRKTFRVVTAPVQWTLQAVFVAMTVGGTVLHVLGMLAAAGSQRLSSSRMPSESQTDAITILEPHPRGLVAA
ncbi:hypothetical protein ACFWN7_05620 [Agromyces sp. NPDC058484]|uniref:hypothetical protein n=1 Tax=Agromyces sp. NPDC058484 TaxID=3346524 RepID=UPI00365F317D